RGVNRLAIERWDEMEVNVDAARRCHPHSPTDARDARDGAPSSTRPAPPDPLCQMPAQRVLHPPLGVDGESLHGLMLNFAIGRASMRHPDVGRRPPCPGWTPTASASISSWPGMGRPSCCCTKWEARSTAGTASALR